MTSSHFDARDALGHPVTDEPRDALGRRRWPNGEAVATPTYFTDAELQFLLGACGVHAPGASTTRPGGTDLTAQGVLALRDKLEGMASPAAPAPPELCRCGNPACPGWAA